ADPTVSRIDLDVLVLGDDREAAATVQALAARIPGVRGVYAGRLRNARQVEALTANLIAINRRYRTHAGIRVTNLCGVRHERARGPARTCEDAWPAARPRPAARAAPAARTRARRATADTGGQR